MSTITSISLGYLSKTNIEALITTAIAYKQKEVTALETQVDTLEVLQGVLTDLNSKFSALDTVAEQLAGLDTTYTFGAARTASLSDSTILSATVSDSASLGAYSIEVTSLAKAHSIRGRSYGQINEALGLSGTFYVGGGTTKQASAQVTDTSVTGFGTADVASGQTQLGSGDYYVEFRQFEGNWQFRLVDAEGTAVAIARADGTSGTTANWQNFSDVASETFDTGRGMTITFAAEPTAAKYIGDAGTPKVSYTAQGAAITVEATHTLSDIKSLINAATYADGNQVQASIVDNSLVLTAAQSGAAHTIIGRDSAGTVLQSLELFDAGGAVMHQLQAATNAGITINGTLTISRSRNTGLTNVIEGLTLNLSKEGSTTLTVATNLIAAENKVKELVSKFNAATSYLRAKMALTEKTTGTNSTNPTYTRGPLAGDGTFMALRSSLYSTIMNRYAHGSLRNLGVEINKDTLALEITDSAALSDALANDMANTTALLHEVGDALNNLLEPFVESDTESVIARRKSGVESSIENYNNRIEDVKERISRDSNRLREQYYSLQQQLLLSLQKQQEWAAFASSTMSTIEYW
ncbi:MAG: flagellar filament capping protein FliD [Anaerolineae bacterium]